MLDLIIGRRELGKTTLAINISQYYSTRVIFDPRHMIETTSDILRDGEISGVLYELLDERAEIIVRPEFGVENAFNEMCAEIYKWLKDNPGEPFCLLIDESRFIKNPEENEQFSAIVRCMPRADVNIILTCHGIVDVSPDLRRIVDFLILFQLTMEADIDRVRERCGEDVAAEVQNLAPYEYIVWNDGIHTWRKHSDPSKWFVSLKRKKVAA